MTGELQRGPRVSPFLLPWSRRKEGGRDGWSGKAESSSSVIARFGASPVVARRLSNSGNITIEGTKTTSLAAFMIDLDSPILSNPGCDKLASQSVPTTERLDGERRHTRISIEPQRNEGRPDCGVPALAVIIVCSWKRHSGELVTPYGDRICGTNLAHSLRSLRVLFPPLASNAARFVNRFVDERFGGLVFAVSTGYEANPHSRQSTT